MDGHSRAPRNQAHALTARRPPAGELFPHLISLLLGLALALAAPLAGRALAAPAPAPRHAPPPARPVSPDLYSGRWYELARTPNRMQADCQGPTTDFQGFAGGDFQVIESCHRGGPQGPLKVVHIKARVLNPPDDTRFRMSFLGGMLHQEYWILDHADDNSWALMGTPGGNFVWILSRRPALPARSLSAALGRLGAMGYATGRLIYPAQGGGPQGGGPQGGGGPGAGGPAALTADRTVTPPGG